jgi:hypothetical protein
MSCSLKYYFYYTSIYILGRLLMGQDVVDVGVVDMAIIMAYFLEYGFDVI